MQETSHTPAAPAAAAPHTPDGDPPASETAREDVAAQPPAGAVPAPQAPTAEHTRGGPPGFGERGRMRRRLRFLRKARELAYRDLGGLVFDLHRFARRNDALVLAKLETIGRIDTELRALEDTLAERQAVTVLREAGVAACPRCAAIHGSDDRFCPNCGLAMDLRAERPMAGPQSAVQAPAPAPATPPAAPAPAPMPTPPAPAPVAPAAHAPAPAMPDAGRTAPAPSSTAAPVPAAATPAPAAPAPSPAAPARDATPPAAPAPAVGDGPAAGDDRANVDQPTEIVRPPGQGP